MKQFLVVYSYKSADGRVNGSGACFIISPSEAAARAVFAASLPGGVITDLCEQKDDPLAQYERPVHP